MHGAVCKRIDLGKGCFTVVCERTYVRTYVLPTYRLLAYVGRRLARILKQFLF